MTDRTYAEAISQATVDAMAADPRLIVLGSGATDFKGIFGTTLEAARRFPDRVFDVPNSEAALGGIVCGVASQGRHVLWIHHRIDFLLYAMDAVCNLLAKWAACYQADPLPVTIRAIVGRGWGQGAQHSQFLGATFAHCPGLTVVAPDDATTSGRWLTRALVASGPWLVIEHRALYPHGRLERRPILPPPARPEVTVVSCSAGVREARLAAEQLWDDHNVLVEVVPIQTLQPLRLGGVVTSLKRTGRLVVLDPGWATYGFSAELVARAGSHGLLRTAAIRLAPPPVPAPTSAPLEAAYWPGADAVVAAVLRLLGREAPATGAARPDGFTGPY